MKKRIISFVLVVLLMVSVLSTTAFAVETEMQEPTEVAEAELILQETEAIEIEESEATVSDNIEEQQPVPSANIAEGPFYSYEKTVNADGTETRTDAQEVAALPQAITNHNLTDKDVGRSFDIQDIEKGMSFTIQPEKSGDYQLHLERPKGVHGMSYVSDDFDFIEIGVFNGEEYPLVNVYENYYLKAGYHYQIVTHYVSKVTFTKNSVEVIELDKKKDTSKETSELFKFIAPSQGTYEFSVQKTANDSTLFLYKSGMMEPLSTQMEESKSKTVPLKKGQACYVTSWKTDWLKVSKTKDKDFVQVDNMWLQNSLEEPIDPQVSFAINQSTGKAVVRSTMKKPWFLIAMNKDSHAATPTLTGSNGKTIKWTYDSMGIGNIKIYGVQLGIDGNARNYKLNVVPESGDKSKAKRYDIAINPKPAKPTGFKATASSKSSAITLKWKKSTDATGYKIYRSDSKSGSYYFLKTISSASTVKYNDKNLSKGKTYYYKLIPYITAGGKTVNGTASSVVSATVKK